MRFNGRPIGDIQPEEIQAIVDDNEPEDQWTDFKGKPYPRTESGRNELCKDVCGLANAGGGYILVGVREENSHAADFEHVNNASREAKWMREVITDGVEPRIDGLDLLPRATPEAKEIVICRVPDSPRRPHMVKRAGQTRFWKRYGEDSRTMSLAEIREAFMGDAVLLAVKEVNDRIAALEPRFAPPPPEPRPDEDALAAGTAERQVAIMRKRFEDDAGDTPFFMCSVWPTAFRRDAVDVDSQEIDNLFRHPPRTRQAGFVIYDPPDVRPTQEGLVGRGGGGRQLTLLRSGYLEFRQHAVESFFQWMQPDQMKAAQPWLYPYAVCELPVCFFRLAVAVYAAAGVTGPFQAILAYRNISGFILLPGHPTSAGFYHAQSDPSVSPRTDPLLSLGPETVTAGEDPDKTAYRFVKRVYAAFGLGPEAIPFFDLDGRLDEAAL